MESGSYKSYKQSYSCDCIDLTNFNQDNYAYDDICENNTSHSNTTDSNWKYNNGIFLLQTISQNCELEIVADVFCISDAIDCCLAYRYKVLCKFSIKYS